MRKSYKHLYLPIEESARELDSRLLLLLAALERGYRIVIGQQWLMTLNLDNFAPGVFFFKGSNKIQANWISLASRSGHRNVVIDEEVTAIAEKRFVLKEVYPESIPLIDRFFIQGKNQYNIYEEAFPDYRDRFSITGNPRFDLLQGSYVKAFEAAGKNYRERYGRYILINTNFGYVNTAWGDPDVFVKTCEKVGYINREDPEDRMFLDDFFELEKRNMGEFQIMIRALRDRFPEHQVILRPHPAEDISTWQNALSGEERIHVVFEGSAVPWMFGADYFIHNTCTTGTEAMVLGVPVGAYASYTNWVESIFLSNLVTPVYRDMERLFQAVEAGLVDREKAVSNIRQAKSSVLREHISGLDKTRATDAIFREIDGLDIVPSSGSLFRDGNGLKRGIHRSTYQRKKIDLSIKELQERVMQLASAAGVEFRAKGAQLGDSLFVISPED